MSGTVFSRRANALENEFFRRVDQELILRLQEQHQHEVDEGALSVATGILDAKVLRELIAAEITPRTLIALSLFPAVCVAWSEGRVQRGEREALLKAAHEVGVVDGSPAYHLLEKWLSTRPSDELFTVWKDFIHAIEPALTPEAFRELREAAMRRALDIAEAAGGFLNILSVSAVERAAIAELESVFDDAIVNGSGAESHHE